MFRALFTLVGTTCICETCALDTIIPKTEGVSQSFLDVAQQMEIFQRHPFIKSVTCYDTLKTLANVQVVLFCGFKMKITNIRTNFIV